ncbi:MAG: hypothetical protein RBQ71_01860 [Acholeplasmataceae bacterium]|nr:hypothetical protein [Acholeplasmataceae bacterium]
MKFKDIILIFILLIITLFIFLPFTNPIFVNLTTSYPYVMGFMKTMILASMGEMLVRRIKTGLYFNDPGFLLKAVVWGLIGMTFVFVFPLFDGGIKAVFQNQIVFESEFFNRLFYALMVSISMNLIFAPTFMMLHRMTDTYILLSQGSLLKMKKVSLNDVVNHIDFKFFFSFVILKTIPIFWIPAHTITFMLPATYRVLMAAYLSMALGILLTLKKKTV